MAGPFKPNDPPTSIPLPQALPLAPSARMTDEIRQPARTSPQRSFVAPIGDTRTDFVTPRGTMREGYPSTAVSPASLPELTQPPVPEVVPRRPRKIR